MLIIVGGPAGCGKSTAGNVLAEALGTPFLEGDALHPQANIDKMASGHPLTDEDRWGWLASVAKTGAAEAAASNTGMCVGACSSLKKIYRDYIRKQIPQETVVFVFLAVEKEELLRRVSHRKNHFMKADMVQSQLDIMQVPEQDEPHCLVYWNSVDAADCVARIKKIHGEAAHEAPTQTQTAA